jgi:hypothetical protein
MRKNVCVAGGACACVCVGRPLEDVVEVPARALLRIRRQVVELGVVSVEVRIYIYNKCFFGSTI